MIMMIPMKGKVNANSDTNPSQELNQRERMQDKIPLAYIQPNIINAMQSVRTDMHGMQSRGHGGHISSSKKAYMTTWT